MQLLQNHIEEIQTLCVKHNVAQMYLFGSAAANQMKPDSDIDLLVTFLPSVDLLDYADNYFSLLDSLQDLFGRNVDLVSQKSLKNSVLIDQINNSKILLYESANSEIHS
ncbi:MAG: nucleotidyltransferase family protein [Cyclobacteriaceae bacterium]